MIRKWLLIFGLNVAIPIAAVSATAAILNECNNRVTCNYPLSFYVIWIAVPIISMLTAILLPRLIRRYFSALLAAIWLLLLYIVWAGIPELIIFPPLLWGTAAALVLFILIWLSDERTPPNKSLQRTR
jgi:hypothetical protein